jgi:signal transduction histidine kinase
MNRDLTAVDDFSIPFSTGGINDFSVLKNHLYITTGEGVYRLLLEKNASGTNSTTYIDRITANGKDLITGSQLAHFQNYLQFEVSTPFYSPYSKIVYQYRITNNPNAGWQRGAPGQYTFDFAALKPGTYEFQIVATDETRKPISRPAVYRFEIIPPWYQQWAFRIPAALLIIAIGIYIVRLYYKERLRKQQVAFEKQLAVQAERHRISAEIHDDVGAGLSAIRLLTEMTENKLPYGDAKQEVAKIHASIGELSHKMREVIWSLESDNDYLENLLHYIRRQALLLFENSFINLQVIVPLHDVPAIVVKGEKRRHIYLSVKEALHNCLKHSGAKNCRLTITIERSQLKIAVADDGKGFAPSEEEQTGNGLTGMKRRMEEVEGSVHIKCREMTTVEFIIPLKEEA